MKKIKSLKLSPILTFNIKNKALLEHRVKIKDSCLNKNLKSNLDSLEAVTLEAPIPLG